MPRILGDARVLVVDDIAENRDLLTRRLKRLGIHRLAEAANGIQALEALEHLPITLRRILLRSDSFDIRLA